MAGLSMDIKLETRLCEVNGEFGYFHCWEHWSNVIDASPLRGGHPGGQIGQVYGIVEFSGEVRKVDPSKIRFKDETNEQCRRAQCQRSIREINSIYAIENNVETGATISIAGIPLIFRMPLMPPPFRAALRRSAAALIPIS